MRFSQKGILVTAVLVLAACGNSEEILTGERQDVRASLTAPLEARDSDLEGTATRAFTAPAMVNHKSWTHVQGSPTHAVSHPALATSVTHAWSAKIGTGNSRKRRITADPVVAGGLIFTLDANAGVAAHTTNGAAVWKADLTPATDRSDDASGGGLAVVDGQLFVTTGFGELIALDAKTGAERWRQKLGASATGAPTVSGGLVYAVSRDNRAWAVDVKNGRVKWEVPGAPSSSGFTASSAPVVNDRLAVFPFGSGELVGVFRKGGVRIWGASVSGQRRGRTYTSVTDISGMPVISGGTLFAGNQSGRVVALDAGSGERIWTARDGAYGTIWPSADSVFFLSDIGQLVRLDATTGERIWVRDLPHFTKEKTRRRKGVFAHFGPILAGGRLIVASNDKQMRSFDPATGKLLSTTALPGRATTNPVIVDRTLYLVTENGQLHAFR